MHMTCKWQSSMKNKAIHKWDVHAGLTGLINSMSISLPLVGDLRDDAMRPRHWTQLMQACGQTFVMDDKLPLDTLIRLELDKYQDAVTEIVERARAEIKIDQALTKIIGIWGGLTIEYVPFKKTGVCLKPVAQQRLQGMALHRRLAFERGGLLMQRLVALLPRERGRVQD